MQCLERNPYYTFQVHTRSFNRADSETRINPEPNLSDRKELNSHVLVHTRSCKRKVSDAWKFPKPKLCETERERERERGGEREREREREGERGRERERERESEREIERARESERERERDSIQVKYLVVCPQPSTLGPSLASPLLLAP